jgi:hypothetical protein
MMGALVVEEKKGTFTKIGAIGIVTNALQCFYYLKILINDS